MQAFALNCTLKPSPAPSSTDRMCSLLAEALADHDVKLKIARAVDHDIRPGVTSDEGDGDDWPELRDQILEAEVFVLATPIWLGNPSSVCRRVLERLDAFLGETDDRGRPIASDRVALALTVGNEDGAHNVSAQAFQGLNDVGFTLAPGAHAYWVGEAMGSVDFIDLDPVPDKITDTISSAARNAAHLARLLQEHPLPA